MKKLASIICTIAIMFTFFTVAYAAPGDFSNVYDYADVLTDSDESKIEDAIDKMNTSYGFPLVIVTKYSSPEYSAFDYAESFYAGNPDLFETFDNPAGFIFVDDFDNDVFNLYTVGDGDLIISDDEKDDMYNELNSYYDGNDYSATYLHFIEDVKGYYTAFTNTGSPAADATTSSTTEKYDATYDYSAPESNGAYIVDSAELLTAEQESLLLKKIEDIKSKHKIDVVLHTTNSIGSKSIQDYADDFYDYNGYGVGDNKDGLLFMLNMNNGEEGNRDYYTSTTGSAIQALTDYAIKDSSSYINEKVLPFLADGKYYKAFDKYLDLIDIFFTQAETGTPYDSSNPFVTTQEKVQRILIREAVVIGVACFLAFTAIKYLKKKMEFAEKKEQASDYLKPGGTVITNRSEVFSHKHINKVKRATESSSSSSSSGSSTHTSSSGTTHGGGGGKF